MKKILLSFLISGLCFGQVGVGTNEVSPSEVLKVQATNKGVLLPRISIPDLSAPPPVQSPADYLMAYNTNIESGKGFYYWHNNRWNPMLNSENVYKLLGIAKLTIKHSTSALKDNTATGTGVYNSDEAPGIKWKLIPGLSHIIDVSSVKNNLVVNVDGIVQKNNRESRVAKDFISYSIGLFIDGKLKSVRSFALVGKDACLYNNFGLSYNQKDLSVGVHTVEVRETIRTFAMDGYYDPYRNNIAQNYFDLTFGGVSQSCTNLSSDMARTELAVQLTENK